MLAVLILTVSLSVSDATINELVSASEQQPVVPQNLAPPFPNYNIDNKGTLSYPIQQVASNPQNAVNFPNKTILLNLVNTLIDSLNQDDKTILEPEKFKYLLTVVKNFLKTALLNPENLEFNDKFPPIINQKCEELLNNLMNYIKTAYAQILRYCLTTEKCNINNLNNIPSNYNGVNQFYPYAPIQRNSTTYIWPFHEHLPKESMTAAVDLINFISSQKDQGHSIMSMLANYKPSGTIQENIYYNPAQEKNPNGLENPPYVAPGNNQAPSLYPLKEINAKNPNLQPSNIYVPPNMNPVLWQTIFPGLQGSSGDKHKQFVKIHEENDIDVTSSLQPGVETPLLPINGQIAPVNTGIPSVDRKVFPAANPIFNTHPNQVISFPKQVPNPKQNSPQAENKNLNFVDSTRLANMLQYLQYLQNQKMQQSVPQNIWSQGPQQSKSGYVGNNQNQILNDYLANQRLLGVNNQFHQSGLSLNQISPYSSLYNTKYINGQNMFTDNKQGNHGGALFDLNHLLSVANSGKLNAIPNKNGIVELTYMLKRKKPVDESQYYVKYRMPYQTFLYNLENLLNKNPNLRSEPSKLYQVLLFGSNITDTPEDLKELDYESILKLTSANGTLVTAKILDSNDTVADQTLKLVQKLNSQLPVESIINFNTNATKNIQLENQRNGVNGSNNKYSDVNHLLKNIYPAYFDVRRGLYPNLNYPLSTIGQYSPRLQYNPYIAYQAKPTLGNVGVPFLKNNAMPVLPYTNILKNPTLYSPYLSRNHQFGR